MRPALRHPPAFSIDIKPDPAWRALACFVSGLAAAGLTATLLAHWDPSTSIGLLSFATLSCATLAALFTRRWACSNQVVVLRWDGLAWWLRPLDGEEQQVQVSAAMDLDSWLLLRVRMHGAGAWRGARYLPVGTALAQPYWGLLRATLFTA